MLWIFGDVRLSAAAKRTTPLGIDSLVSRRTFCPSLASFIRGRTLASPSLTQGGSRMPESGPFGSVRGVCSNAHPYRDTYRREFISAVGLSRTVSPRWRSPLPMTELVIVGQRDVGSNVRFQQTFKRCSKVRKW